MGDPLSSYRVESFQASDGYRLLYRRYPAVGEQTLVVARSPDLATGPDRRSPLPSEARALLVCLHGIQSHAGWYERSCAEFSRAGLEVYFLDRRGSGMNELWRGDTPSYRRLLEDIAELLHERLHGGQKSPARLPVFLLGISWGGKLAVAFARYRPEQVAGLALLCPGFFPRVRPAWAQRLRIGWSRIVAPTRSFPIPLNDPELFTATPRWQSYIQDDVVSLRRATARFFVESIRLDRYLRSASPFVTVPVLLLLAERDRIIDNAATRHYIERFATRDQEIIEYPGASHTLEFEPDPSRFINDVRAWLDRHAAAVGAQSSHP